MKKHSMTFCALALLAANSCAMAGIFTIFSIVEGMDKTDPGLAVWLVCLSLCYVGLNVFLRREQSERSLIIFCAVFFAMQLVLVLLLYGFFSGTISILSAVCMWLYSYYTCYELALKPVTAEKITKSFDLCSLVLIFALFFCSVKAVPIKLLLPMACSNLLCLIALVIARGGPQRKVRSVLLSSCLILVFAAVAALFTAFASGGVKKLFSFMTAAVKAIMGFILGIIETVFRFLAALFPEKEYDSLAPVPTEPPAFGDPPDMSFELISPETVMTIIIGTGIAVAVAIIIYRLLNGKRVRVTNTVGGGYSPRRERSSMADALKRAFLRIFARIAFAFSAIVAWNSAPGLFWQIERRSRKKLHGRRQSESCREFLARAESLYPHAGTVLERLADALDSLYFGTGQRLSAAEIIKMRKAIFKLED